MARLTWRLSQPATRLDCHETTFFDGNKRTGWVLARTFLLLNGKDLSFDEQEAIEKMMALASGELGEVKFASWLRDNLT